MGGEETDVDDGFSNGCEGGGIGIDVNGRNNGSNGRSRRDGRRSIIFIVGCCSFCVFLAFWLFRVGLVLAQIPSPEVIVMEKRIIC